MESIKKSGSIEIVSFNADVPEMSTLLELDDADLEHAIGGEQEPIDSCGLLTDCPRLECEINCGNKCGIRFRP